jgi:para-aminobenzoate synthetase component I
VNTPLLLPAPPGPPLRELAAALPDERHPILLDSGGPPSRVAAWSYLLCDPAEVLVRRATADGAAFADLQAALRRRWPDARPPAGGGGVEGPDEQPAFRGGAVGWLAYDLGRELERLPQRAVPDADVPDLHVGLYDFALAEQVGTTPLPAPQRAAAPPISTFSRAAYEAAVRAVREHILDGDVYQVNLSQRLQVDYAGRPEPLQAALAARFPAPFGALLRAPGLAVISSSPELFLRRRGETVLSRPIKGTRPRGADPARDAVLRAELETSDKEHAELAMIVDLVRNDLGRVCEWGSVHVPSLLDVEAHPGLVHLVSTVEGTLRPGHGWAETIAATFPPGSVTGAPKLAALSYIAALETAPRGVYCGAIGWVDADRLEGDLNVAIRTFWIEDHALHLGTGGGITWDSTPAGEWAETELKARRLLQVASTPEPIRRSTAGPAPGHEPGHEPESAPSGAATNTNSGPDQDRGVPGSVHG